MQTGWWRIADGRLLKELTKTLHQRYISCDDNMSVVLFCLIW